MKPLIAILSLTLAAVAFAPAGSAHSIDPIFPKCETVYDFPDLGWVICVNPLDPECEVYQYRTTIAGTERSCVFDSDDLPTQQASAASGPDCYPVYSRTDVGVYSIVRRSSCSPPEVYRCPYEGAPIDQCQDVLGLQASASSSGIPWPGGQTPDVQCMDVYGETYLANGYWLVRRDSCSVQVYECPEGYSPPAPPCHEAQLLSSAAVSASTPQVDCYYVYTRYDVETYSIVRRSSCAVPEVYKCPYQGAPLNQCHHVQDDLLSAQASSSEPMCMYYYYEVEAGPVRHVQRDSCHSENYVCEQTTDDILADGLDASRCDTGLTAAASQPLPPVPDPMERTCYRQGQGELQSQYCIDPTSTDCTVYWSRTTGVGGEWWCYPSGDHGSYN